jgi:hypothetical protein
MDHEPLTMKTLHSFATPRTIHPATQRHIPEDSHPRPNGVHRAAFKHNLVYVNAVSPPTQSPTRTREQGDVWYWPRRELVCDFMQRRNHSRWRLHDAHDKNSQVRLVLLKLQFQKIIRLKYIKVLFGRRWVIQYSLYDVTICCVYLAIYAVPCCRWLCAGVAKLQPATHKTCSGIGNLYVTVFGTDTCWFYFGVFRGILLPRKWGCNTKKE